MTNKYKLFKNSYARKMIVLITIMSFFVSSLWSIPNGYAQGALNLPAPGTMVHTSPSFIPVLLKGMTIHPEDPLWFDFIVNSGHTDLNNNQIQREAQKLVKYFLAAMTVPMEDLWVNLSPYEQERIIPEELSKTALGRDLLAQDYLLKQLTASLIYPEKELGGKFWDNVYRKAQEKFGTTEIPMSTFNKVWILPESASVYEHEQTVYIVESRLKVMLDEDFLAMNNSQDFEQASEQGTAETEFKDSASLSSQMIREIILPEIEREVNEGKNFAPLRQIYHSLILAKWYKETLKETLFDKVYIDQNKVAGVEINDQTIKDKIYERYMQAYKQGVFDYIKEDYDQLSQQVIPKKYFSGGIQDAAIDLEKAAQSALAALAQVGGNFRLSVKFAPFTGGAEVINEAAMDDQGQPLSELRNDVPPLSLDWMKPPEQRLSNEELEAYAANIRQEALRIWEKIEGPLSGAFSIVELYTVLFMNYIDPLAYLADADSRPRIIPKITSAPSLYSAAAFAGILDPQRVVSINSQDLSPIPHRSGVGDVSPMKIGISLEQAIGLAIADRMQERNKPVITFLSDGGMQPGKDHQAKFAAKMQLNNLAVIVDVNGLQSSYAVDDVDVGMAQDAEGYLTRQRQEWEGYGWNVVEIDGHDFDQIHAAYDLIGQGDRPYVILARTKKGKGIEEMEDSLKFNHRLPETSIHPAEEELDLAVLRYRKAGHHPSYPYITVPNNPFDHDIDLKLPSLMPQNFINFDTFLKRWLELLAEMNPGKVAMVDTDNPAPFPKETPIYAPGNKNPRVFVGINERFAIHVSGGLHNAGVMPFYIGPASHMPAIADDFKLLAFDEQNVMVVARDAGSSQARWGQTHAVYEDVLSFRTPGAVVYQPANIDDLNLILEHNYANPDQTKPIYLRLHDTPMSPADKELFDTAEKRAQIINDGFYVIDSNVSDADQEYATIIVSGKIVPQALMAALTFKKRGIPYKIVNVINLSEIDSARLQAELKGTNTIVTAIDAKAESLSSLIYEALPEQRNLVKAFGITDGLNYRNEMDALKDNKLDSQGITEAVTGESGLGGIKLDEIDIDRQGSGINIHFNPAVIEPFLEMEINGFSPVFINFSPIEILPILGLAPRLREEDYKISSLE